MLFHILQCIKNLSIEDLARLTLLENVSPGYILNNMPQSIMYLLCMLAEEKLSVLPAEWPAADQQIVAKLRLINEQLKRLHQHCESMEHLIQLYLEKICALRHYDEMLRDIDAQAPCDATAYEQKKNILNNPSQELQFEKQCLVARVNKARGDIQKINKLQSACDTYIDHLSHVVLSAKECGKHLISSQEVKLAKAKLKSVKNLSQILNRQDDAPEARLITFDTQFHACKETLSLHRDSAATIFLKIVATVLSAGIAAPWLWSKPKGALFSDCLGQTLIGNNLKPLAAFTLSENNEYEPLMQPKAKP